MKLSFINIIYLGIVLLFAGSFAKFSEPQLLIENSESHLLEGVDASPGASVLGEFRTSITGYLWVKIDEYIHGGVSMRTLTPEEQKRNDIRKASQAENTQNGTHDERNETTVVPEAGRDWRGILGEIERQTQPFFDVRNHTHHDPREALPLFRFSTWIDPHFVTGYVVGAEVLSRDSYNIPQALRFLREGEKNNPHSIELKEELGRYYSYYFHDYVLALSYLERAIQLGAGRKTLTYDEQDALLNAHRWRVIDFKRKGDKQAELHALHEALRAYPKDPIFRKMMHEMT